MTDWFANCAEFYRNFEIFSGVQILFYICKIMVKYIMFSKLIYWVWRELIEVLSFLPTRLFRLQKRRLIVCGWGALTSGWLASFKLWTFGKERSAMNSYRFQQGVNYYYESSIWSQDEVFFSHKLCYLFHYILKYWFSS